MIDCTGGGDRGDARRGSIRTICRYRLPLDVRHPTGLDAALHARQKQGRQHQAGTDDLDPPDRFAEPNRGDRHRHDRHQVRVDRRASAAKTLDADIPDDVGQRERQGPRHPHRDPRPPADGDPNQRHQGRQPKGNDARGPNQRGAGGHLQRCVLQQEPPRPDRVPRPAPDGRDDEQVAAERVPCDLGADPDHAIESQKCQRHPGPLQTADRLAPPAHGVQQPDRHRQTPQDERAVGHTGPRQTEHEEQLIPAMTDQPQTDQPRPLVPRGHTRTRQPRRPE